MIDSFKAPKGKYKISGSFNGKTYERDGTPEDCEALDKQEYKPLIVTACPIQFAGGSYKRNGNKAIVDCKGNVLTYPAGMVPKEPITITMNYRTVTAEFEVDGWDTEVVFSNPCKHEPTFSTTTLGVSADARGNTYPTSTSKCGHCNVTLHATWGAK